MRRDRLYCSPPASAMLLAMVIFPLGSAVVTCLLALFILKRVSGRKVAGVLAGVLSLIVAGLVYCRGVENMRTLSRRMCCQSSLRQFDLALSGYCYPPRDTYPMSLAGLSSNDISSELFVCPADSESIALRDIGAAAANTAYIYVAGLKPPCPPDMPIILCPPLCHSGKGGSVLMGDHSTRWVPLDKFEKLIDGLYADTNLSIVVSQGLERRSKGKYISRPGTGRTAD